MFSSDASTPWGLRPDRYKSGAKYSGGFNIYHATAADQIGIGDPVKLAAAADSSGYPSAVIATAGAAACGVVVGICQVKPGQHAAALAANSGFSQTLYKTTANTDCYLMVADDPDIIFQIQEDGDSESTVVASVGLNANWVATTCNTTTGLSGFKLDSSSKATTSTLNLKILGLSYRMDGSNTISAAGAAGNYACFDVIINNHQLAPNTAGV